jgi:AcrR family transcriptional regulator
MVHGSSQDSVMTKTQRKEREFQMRRTVILAEAEKIFSIKGYHDVTVAEIAAAAGFSTGFLYQFFEGKEHLYTAMISEKINWMYENIQRDVNSADDLQKKISLLIESHLQFVENNPDLCRIFLRGQSEALSAMMTSIREKLIGEYLNHLSFAENILKAGVKSGLLRALPAREMASLLMHIIRAASIDWLLLSSKDSLTSRKDFILDVYLNGVKKNEG